jgi:hypothetical protein
MTARSDLTDPMEELVSDLSDPSKWPDHLSPVEVLDLFCSWAKRLVEDRAAPPPPQPTERSEK